MLYLLVVAATFISNIPSLTQKKFCAYVNYNTAATDLFMVGIATSVSITYFFLAKGNIFSNKYAVIFGLVYGFICSASNIILVKAYSKISLIEISLYQKASIVLTWLCGIIFFKDAIKLTGIISVVIILLSVLFPVFSLDKKRSKNISSYVIGFYIAVSGMFSSALLKTYALLPGSDYTGISVLCFYTNIFMLVILGAKFVKNSEIIKNRKQFMNNISGIKPTYFLLLIPYAICNALGTFLSLPYLKEIPLSVQTIFSTGASSVVYFIFSKFIFKEDIDKYTLFGWILATLAAAVSVF